MATPPSTVSAPPQVPDHELLRCIGGGSYGEVWLARNALGAYRAVKVVRRASFDHDRPFEREFAGIQRFEPISRQHEGLVDLLQVGRNETEGYFYYVMELADGIQESAGREQGAAKTRDRATPGSSCPVSPDSYGSKTLRSEIQCHGRLPLEDCIALGLCLTRALAYLHGQGLVHRDIKPSNIIFVGGVPKLADVGLVAGVGEARSYVGTEGFIPPEGPGTAQADLYGLGILLYVMSTGKSHEDFPEPLPDLAAQPDHARWLEFNAVVHKACAANPRERYGHAQEMQADLELLCACKSVKQRHSMARRWKIAKQVGVATVVAAVLIPGLVWLRPSRLKPLDPLTTGKNVGGYPPTVMRGTTNKEAWDHYRLGYFAHRRKTKEGEEQAMVHLNRAITADPRFTLAYATLWRAKFMDTWLLTHAENDEWRRLADKLVELDNGLAETHHILGFIRFWEWKWPEAEAEYREALRLNPGCVPAYILLGFQLSHLGRTDEAIQVLDRGLQLDPNEPQLVKMKGHACFVRRQFQAALDLYLESVRREPLFANSRLFTARAYVALTNYPAAIDELEQHKLLWGVHAPDAVRQEHAELRRAFQEGGPRGFWLKRLEQTQARWKPDEHPYSVAQICAWLGDKEQALALLEKAYERRDELVYSIFDECWDAWRDEPRFEAVRQKVGLPRHPNFPAK